MDLRQLLNRPEKPKPKLQLLLAKSGIDSKTGYCIALMNSDNRYKLLHSTDDINPMIMYQCYSPEWYGHNGCNNELNHTFCRLYNTPKDKFWNIQGKYLTPIKPEEFPYKKFLEYKNIEEEIIRIQAEIGVEHNLGRLEGIDWEAMEDEEED